MHVDPSNLSRECDLPLDLAGRQDSAEKTRKGPKGFDNAEFLMRGKHRPAQYFVPSAAGQTVPHNQVLTANETAWLERTL